MRCAFLLLQLVARRSSCHCMGMHAKHVHWSPIHGCRELAIIDIFDRNTSSIVNIFDVTLQVAVSPPLLPTHPVRCKAVTPPVHPRQATLADAAVRGIQACQVRGQRRGVPPSVAVVQGQPRPAAQEDAAEGNGTGFVWDAAGNIVTNYHVLQGALAALNRRPGGPAKSAQEGSQRPVVAKVTLLGEGCTRRCC